MRHLTLNERGFGHILVGMLIVVGIGLFGTYYVVRSHAQSLNSDTSTTTVSGSSATCGKASGPFHDSSGSKVLQASGKAYVAYGITMSDLQNADYAASTTVSTIHQKLNAIASNWCSNTVRLQVEQDMLVGEGGGSYSKNYMDAIKSAVSYAENLGLVVVINDTTEPSSGASGNEPLPTKATEVFWDNIDNAYAKDPQVIYDLFNEPRSYSNNDWSLWHDGGKYSGKTYIGMQALADHVRKDGSKNLFWLEGIHFSDTLAGVPSHAVNGDGPVVYAIHHPTPTDPHNSTTWYNDFGFMEVKGIAPVVVGEWTQWAQTTKNQNFGECWANAPTAVPNFLSYLGNHGIGMTAWTLNGGVLNSSNGVYTSVTKIKSNWACKDGLDQGAGSLIQAWYVKQNS